MTAARAPIVLIGASVGLVVLALLALGAGRYPLAPGDVVTVALDRSVRVLKVQGFVERRGSADVARVLYEDLSPAAPPKSATDEAAPGQREPGAGRPTKRDRRAIERLDEW